MADSTLDPDNIPVGTDRKLGSGHDKRTLGPSDTSDSGSDLVGESGSDLDSDTDAEGTGESDVPLKPQREERRDWSRTSS
ncbi:hypothetical protein GTP46_27335 [Duganella sp. FT135W]|uniref:MatE family transporter n=1 Tax=Duganella flavida TaxID=2692175 RepID=A0A6L8KJF4_9BURK|nr:hypothetical protein [Duganella flavida]MYM26348.1 hypothetical protein [Duganella flavida]